ncbi:hypothetical protein SCOR_30300 [Sulfidibacter corallicola]
MSVAIHLEEPVAFAPDFFVYFRAFSGQCLSWMLFVDTQSNRSLGVFHYQVVCILFGIDAL